VLEAEGLERVHLAAPAALAPDFEGFDLVAESEAGGERAPQAVVLGDLGRDFTWDRLDGLFRMVHAGARLIALHRNRHSRRGERIALDLGPFVAAIEYAADVEAVVAGKPSRALFESALAELAVAADEAVMVGDDVEADVGGALGAGLRAVQVRTGKYTEADEAPGKPAPTARIASVADLPGWLDAEGRGPGALWSAGGPE
jgi:HAD superfamily hydrolase (TIGR01458 family)